jgi:hypothetical protein
MRILLALCVAAALGVCSGCGSRSDRAPHLVGKLEGGTFWKNPLSATRNEGSEHQKGSRVEVYDQFIVVTTPDGISYVHPHGYYSGLMFKKD